MMVMMIDDDDHFIPTQVKEIASLTSSVMIGFGSFVDKEALPYMGIYDNM